MSSPRSWSESSRRQDGALGVLVEDEGGEGAVDAGNPAQAVQHHVAQALHAGGADEHDEVGAASGQRHVLDLLEGEQVVADRLPALLLDAQAHEGRDGEAEPPRVDPGGEAGQDPVAAQALEAGVGVAARDAELVGQLQHGDAPVGAQHLEHAAVDAVQRSSGLSGHFLPPSRRVGPCVQSSPPAREMCLAVRRVPWTAGHAVSDDAQGRAVGPVSARRSFMGIFEKMVEHGHEQVVFCYDGASALRAIIAIHDTAIGPARGGTRYKHYESEEEALDDALRLSKGMSYKFAFTDMPRGGGKGVILRDDSHQETDRRLLLRAYGRFVQLLAGRFGTGPDLGTTSHDMVTIAEQTDYVWAVDREFGGTGDSTPLTAQGVLAGMRVALEETDGSGELAGRRVAVQGLGGVGARLAELLIAAGASVIGAD